MATTPNISALLGNQTQITQALSSTAGTLALVTAEVGALNGAGNVADVTNLWPKQCQGTAFRLVIAGDQKVETAYHKAMEQGRMLETDLGGAMAWIQRQKMDLDEKILGYLNLNRLTLDAQLPDSTRPAKMVVDSIAFIQQIRVYTQQIAVMLQALQANVAVLLATGTRMLNMIQANLNALTNLLQEICNWQLPTLPSLATQLGSLWHWNGFNFNSVAGFKFNTNLGLNFNFSFSQCSLRTPNLAAFFGAAPSTTASDGILTFSPGVIPLPPQGTFGDPTQFAVPAYITQMQKTTTPVFNPALVGTSSPSSLPNPASIISNYSLPAAQYTANVVSAVPALQPLVIQPDDPDFATGIPSAAREANLRSTLIRFVTLDMIVGSGYDPNVMAAWLLYLNLNRTGRGGSWIQNFEVQYATSITPSVTYVQNTPVPWNNVLGGAGISDAPAAIPLIAALQADTTNDLKWRLSFIEASLLGYPRSRTWDSAADTVFTGSFTNADLDYVPATVTPTPTFATILGADTASFPVSAAVPQSIASVFAQVVTLATNDIAITPSYQTTRPQFRFTFDQFAQATVVDRFTQFWRQFNANLQALLTEDPFVIAYICNYVDVLNSAINPLADPTDFNIVSADAMSRNRTWLPGSVLPPVPLATVSVNGGAAPTDQSNGWTTGTLDPVAFLARPDIQAQSIPVQIAMLRTNQSFSSLMTLKADLQSAINTAVANAQIVASQAGMPGWEVESNTTQAVPPGVQGMALAFPNVDFDQTNYVQDTSAIQIQSTNPFILNTVINWDPTGSSGTRTVNLLHNGVVIATASADSTSATPFTTQLSNLFSLNLGDVLQVQVFHSCLTSQNVLTGSTFLGLLDVTAPGSTPPTPVTPGSSGTGSSTTLSLTADTALNVLTAVVIQPDGGVLPVDPTVKTPGVTPVIDGIALTSAGQPGDQISVAVCYGQSYTVDIANFVVGGLIYINSNGSLTQDFSSLQQSVRWVMVIGKALTQTSFLYQPQIPTNLVLNF